MITSRSRRRALRLSSWMVVLFPALAMAQPVQIPGPQGPLEAEMIAVPGAAHAVVIIPGSGPVDRDGNSGAAGLASDSYRLLAQSLAASGVASLRIDKRGMHGSGLAIPDPNDVTIAAYAEDARKWVDRAATLARCVWIAGHSEGGLVALVAAQDAPENLCGLILLATAGRPAGQLLIEQLGANPANAPLMPEIADIIADLEAGHTRAPASMTAVLRPLFPQAAQGYMIDLFAHDPASIASGWQGPVLIVQGDADIQVRSKDADLLEKAMPQARRVDLVGATHMLKPDVAGLPFATYADPRIPLHGALQPAIAGFLAVTTAP